MAKFRDPNALPLVVSVRTGLISEDDALSKTLPSLYEDKTIEEALDYALRDRGLEPEEIRLAKSIRQEMNADNYTVAVNGENTDLDATVKECLVRKMRHLPDGEEKAYHALEIEVSSVETGGQYHR